MVSSIKLISGPVILTTYYLLLLTVLCQNIEGGQIVETHSTIQHFYKNDSPNIPGPGMCSSNIMTNCFTIRTPVLDIKTLVTAIKEIVVDRCPASQGFFYAPGTGQSQCLKVFNLVKISWEQAKKVCQMDGLQLARPYNAVQLRDYITQRYDIDEVGLWLDGRGDGSTYKWQYETGNNLLSNESPLWMPGNPGSNLGDNYCLLLDTNTQDLKEHPDKPYKTQPCSGKHYYVCEKSF